MGFITNILAILFFLGLLGYCLMILWVNLSPDKEGESSDAREVTITTILATVFGFISIIAIYAILGC